MPRKGKDEHRQTLIKLILSGEIMDVLAWRDAEDLDDGRDTEAVTAVAMMVLLPRKNKRRD